MIRIVIDIPKHVYEHAKERIEDSNDEWDAMRAIANGTLLLKGHGDLIYRSEVIESLFDYHNGKKTLGQCIDDVQTIIEADKAESEDKE